jgi:hypothetical protein
MSTQAASAAQVASTAKVKAPKAKGGPGSASPLVKIFLLLLCVLWMVPVLGPAHQLVPDPRRTVRLRMVVGDRQPVGLHPVDDEQLRPGHG